MSDLNFRLYCYLHNKAKQILGRASLTTGDIFKLPSLTVGTNSIEAKHLWEVFINRSSIIDKDYNGLHYAGYIAENEEWCLPSWIWTNSAIIRQRCLLGQLSQAESIASLIAQRQEVCGGWIVRNDYDKLGAIPILAPNDSAYIANNAFLSLYEATNKSEYLEIAIKCADWIIETARPDGMVYVGYNIRDHKWVEDCVIVDVGFTAGLFAKLAKITNDRKYHDFLKRFILRYIELFYIPSKHGFCTSINRNNKQQGGMFGRGQAWALEGLIPAYKILQDNQLKQVIDSTVENLLNIQSKNGAWSYNLSNPLMGQDCKAVSVIAKNLMDWYSVTLDAKLLDSVNKAINWCYKHTAIDGEAKGGIFSFCMEGAIVQNLYTSCAFVYASAYAIELDYMLRK